MAAPAATAREAQSAPAPSPPASTLRVLWPRHLCEELEAVGQGLLYGYFIAPAKPSLSPYCSAVVIGAVAAPPSLARRAQAEALARPHVPPKHDQWRIQLRVLGTWHANEADAVAAAAEAEQEAKAEAASEAATASAAAVLDPPLLLLHAWGGRTHSPAASNFAARVQLPDVAGWRLPTRAGGRAADAAAANGIAAPAAATTTRPHQQPPPSDLQLFGYTLPREGHGHILLSSNALGGSAAAAAPWLAPRPAVAQGQPPPATCFVMGDLVAPWPWLQPVQGASALEMAVACANRAEAAARAVAIALRDCQLGGGTAADGEDEEEGPQRQQHEHEQAGLRCRRPPPLAASRAAPPPTNATPTPSTSSSSSSNRRWCWSTDRAALERRLWFRLCSGGGAGCLARQPLDPAVLGPPPAALAALLPSWWPWRRRRWRRRDGEDGGATADAAAATTTDLAPPLTPLAAAVAMARWAASVTVHASSTGRFASRKLRAYRRGAAAAASSSSSSSSPPSPPPPFALTAAQRWDAAALNAARLHTERDVTAELAQHACGLVFGLLLARGAPAAGAALAALCARLYDPRPRAGGPLAAVADWLASAAPGGVKLHAELALLLGAAVRGLLAGAARLYASEAGAALLTATAYGVAALSACFGLSAGLAAAADAVGLVAWPVGLAYAGLAALYSLQRRAIAVTWGLMRGAGTADVVAAAQAVAARRRRRQRQRRERQQQRRRQEQQQHLGKDEEDEQEEDEEDERTAAAAAAAAARPSPVEAAAVLWGGGGGGSRGGGSGDNKQQQQAGGEANTTNGAPNNNNNNNGASASSDEVAAEHLIVGVLLFTPLIALLPTTAAFYAAAALAHGATATLRLALLLLARQLVLNPLAYAAARRAATPRLFPGDLSVSALRPVDGGGREEVAAAGAGAAHDDGTLPRRAAAPPPTPAPRCYLLGNRPLHYSQLLHGVALAPLGADADGARAAAASALRCFWTGRPFGFLL